MGESVSTQTASPAEDALPLVNTQEFVRDLLFQSHTVLPKELDVDFSRVLGKGSNNTVYRATWNGTPAVFRVPRRGSDTQQRGSAKWECMAAMIAAENDAGPALYRVWHARHTTRIGRESLPCGLYMVGEYFEHDLEAAMYSLEHRDLMTEKSEVIASKLADCLRSLSAQGILVYDLKLSNVVIRIPTACFPPDGDDDDGIVVRIIDFGKDFCECRMPSEVDVSTPIMDMTRRLVEQDFARRGETHGESVVDSVTKHILYVAMLVQVGSTVSRQLYEDRRDHHMSRATRANINGITRVVRSELDNMQGSHRNLLRRVLRSDDVKGVLQHYNGKRNAGTKRTLRYAQEGA